MRSMINDYAFFLNPNKCSDWPRISTRLLDLSCCLYSKNISYSLLFMTLTIPLSQFSIRSQFPLISQAFSEIISIINNSNRSSSFGLQFEEVKSTDKKYSKNIFSRHVCFTIRKWLSPFRMYNNLCANFAV